MENRKWLKRRYPLIFEEVNDFLNDEQLGYFKDLKYKLGRLTVDINQEEIYYKDSLCFFKRSNPVNDYNYPLHQIIVKCSDRLTTSGYNCFWVSPEQVEEVK